MAMQQLQGSGQMSDNLQIVAVPKELYYHEVAYVRGLEKRIEALEAALREIAKGSFIDGTAYDATRIARAALAPEQDK